MKVDSTLNYRAHRICEFLDQLQDELRIASRSLSCGARVYDYGVDTRGGLRAGVHLAEICLAGLSEVKLLPHPLGQSVSVYTDHPIAACLASQYAGWQLNVDDVFAMGSGPMRAAAAKEPVFKDIGFVEKADHVVGVLETRQQPTDALCEQIANDCGVQPQNLTVCVAPTASFAGTTQVVARSAETAMHKMHELGFDVNKIKSVYGHAPLPPIASDDVTAIGRTNDAVLYGSEVTLWIQSEDAELAQLIDDVPSQSSSDFGIPFAQIFERYQGDFYSIDPNLFSPAKVTLINLNSGRSFVSGEIHHDVLQQSFDS